MTAMQTARAETTAAMPLPCPGPVPTSADHAARCRACGACAQLADLFDIDTIESQTATNSGGNAGTPGRTLT